MTGRPSSLVPERYSRRWRHFDLLTEATMYLPDGSIAWVSPPNYVLLRLRGDGDDPPTVFVPVPEALIADTDVDLWWWVRDRADRAYRAGRLMAPMPRRWPATPPDAGE